MEAKHQNVGKLRKKSKLEEKGENKERIQNLVPRFMKRQKKKRKENCKIQIIFAQNIIFRIAKKQQIMEML